MSQQLLLQTDYEINSTLPTHPNGNITSLLTGLKQLIDAEQEQFFRNPDLYYRYLDEFYNKDFNKIVFFGIFNIAQMLAENKDVLLDMHKLIELSRNYIQKIRSEELGEYIIFVRKKYPNENDLAIQYQIFKDGNIGILAIGSYEECKNKYLEMIKNYPESKYFGDFRLKMIKIPRTRLIFR